MSSLLSSSHKNFSSAAPSLALARFNEPQITASPRELIPFYERLCPEDRIAVSYELFGKDLLITNSGGIQSRLIPTMITEILEDPDNAAIKEIITCNPIVFIDTGDHFAETLHYVEQTARMLPLPYVKLRHGLTPDEFRYNMDLLIATGYSSQDAFDELTKVRPLSEYIRQHDKRAWISGNRWDQSLKRSSLSYIQEQNGMVKIYPLLDQKRAQIDQMMRVRNIEPHPLAARFRSIGNRSETLEGGGTFEKSGRHLRKKSECGLHERWVRRGQVFVTNEDGALLPQWKFPIIFDAFRKD